MSSSTGARNGMLALASAPDSAFGVVVASTLRRSLLADGDHSAWHLSPHATYRTAPVVVL
jgi:hypothetical protein